MPGFKVKQRDPSGAGDAARAAGAACVTGLGATTSVTRENVNNLLKEQGKRILEQTRLKKQ
jgi:sugar/nucleoside kinase (ribokinase family)